MLATYMYTPSDLGIPSYMSLYSCRRVPRELGPGNSGFVGSDSVGGEEDTMVTAGCDSLILHFLYQ